MKRRPKSPRVDHSPECNRCRALEREHIVDDASQVFALFSGFIFHGQELSAKKGRLTDGVYAMVGSPKALD
jgi:hypothetical protein